MLGTIIEAGAYVVVDTGLFENPEANGATLQLRFRKIDGPAEAAASGLLVKCALSAAALAGLTLPDGIEAADLDPLDPAQIAKAVTDARSQAAAWCRGASVDGGQTWIDLRLTLDEAEQNVQTGPLWVGLFPDTLWPQVVTRCWSDYAVALSRVGRFPGRGVPTPGNPQPADGADRG